MSAEGVESARDHSRTRLSGKAIVLLVVVFGIVLLAGGAIFKLGGVEGVMRLVTGGEKTVPAESKIQISYYDLPDLLVNLRSDTSRPAFLKLSLTLEVQHAEDKAGIDLLLPRVIDSFQTYLREMKPDQLQGAAGLFRLREQLLARVNAVAAPTRISDVLFKEMLVQ